MKQIIHLLSLYKIALYALVFRTKFPASSLIFGFPRVVCGSQMVFGENFQIGRFSRLQGKIQFGKNFFLNEFGSIISGCNNNSEIVIGDNVIIGPYTYIVSGDHGFGKGQLIALSETGKHQDIHIGNNVWIGAKVIILKGVNIGDNVVIGAGSVVTKDIPDSCLAVGNPCKVIKSLS